MSRGIVFELAWWRPTFFQLDTKDAGKGVHFVDLKRAFIALDTPEHCKP
ncbi:hypothetical protein OOT46_16770 [Aquabacterium sp. A7-Y]|nr:hypothetical protein [Aquabacterium sp. A7-Y]MCW7539497.1 hypothetical protein [Aquabacterium sp. A7-Y]